MTLDDFAEEHRLSFVDNDFFAENSERVLQARARFDAVSKEYTDVFVNQYASSLEHVERGLKYDLLCQILEIEESKPTEERNPEIISLLTENNRRVLALGESQELLLHARALFISNTDIHQIAWRAYDVGAPTEEWDNLFAAPLNEKNVYGGAQKETISLKRASDEIRMQAAMYYLAAKDESNDELKATTKDRLNGLFAIIAECRRAHNIASGRRLNTKTDNPSCYPGTETRLSDSVLSHPKFKEENSRNIEKMIYSKVKLLVENTLIAMMSAEGMTPQEKQKYYLSVLMLGLDNTCEILDTPPSELKSLGFGGEEFDMDELTVYRAKILHQLNAGGGREQILTQILAYIIEEGIGIDNTWVEYFILKAVLDLKGLGLSFSHEQARQLGMFEEVLPSFTATAANAGAMAVDDDEEENEEAFVRPASLSAIKAYQAYKISIDNKEKKETYLYENYYKPLLFHFLSIELTQKFPGITENMKRSFILNEFLAPRRPTCLEDLERRLCQAPGDVFARYNEYNPMPTQFSREPDREKLLAEAMQNALTQFEEERPCGFKRARSIDRDELNPAKRIA